jgi:hypothetical protein
MAHDTGAAEFESSEAARDGKWREPVMPRFFWLVVVVGLIFFASIVLRPVEPGIPLMDGQVADAEEEEAQSGAGANLYISSGCGECHTTSGADTALGPSLSGSFARAESRLAAGQYTGSAISAREYLVESILNHCVDRLPGYACPELPELSLRLSVEEAETIAGFISRLSLEERP